MTDPSESWVERTVDLILAEINTAADNGLLHHYYAYAATADDDPIVVKENPWQFCCATFGVGKGCP